MIRRTLVSALVACGLLACASSASANTLTPTFPLLVNESLPGFVAPAQPIVVKSGISKYVTLVPGTAVARHGIGVDGGAYDHVEGGSVTPGHTSSLTIFLKPGNYTFYDPEVPNGISTLVRAVKQPATRGFSGKHCVSGGFDVLSSAWTRYVKCTRAEAVGRAAYESWSELNFDAKSVSALGYRCKIKTREFTGLNVTCKRGNKRIIFAL